MKPIATDANSLDRVVQFYETLDRAALVRLEALYEEDAFFKDPFNEVHGVPAIRRIFEHMFLQVDAPRFVVTSSVGQGDQAFLVWEMHFRMKRHATREQCIRGATHLRFGPSGMIEHHRDYWDVAEELYEKLPLLGSLMRWLKRAGKAR
jgi:steroid delta-isomerase